LFETAGFSHQLLCFLFFFLFALPFSTLLLLAPYLVRPSVSFSLCFISLATLGFSLFPVLLPRGFAIAEERCIRCSPFFCLFLLGPPRCAIFCTVVLSFFSLSVACACVYWPSVFSYRQSVIQPPLASVVRYAAFKKRVDASLGALREERRRNGKEQAACGGRIGTGRGNI
jgi:hypothetical protein